MLTITEQLYKEMPDEIKSCFSKLPNKSSEEVLELFPKNIKGEIGRAGRKSGGDYKASNYKMGVVTETGFKDSGSAARFFYCAKASAKERNMGGIKSTHPTMKPIKLMEYLVNLVSPEKVWGCPNCDIVIDSIYETKGNNVQTMQFSTSRDGQEEKTKDFLREKMCFDLDDSKQKNNERVDDNKQGIQTDNESDSSKSKEVWVCDGTQIGDGKTFGENPGGLGSGTSSQWDKDGQQSRESSSTTKTYSRQNTEATTETYSMPTLSKNDKSIRTCKKCGENLIKKPSIILDPFCGSGTTGIACKKLNRNFIGIERDEEYCKIAEARIESVSQNNTLFV